MDATLSALLVFYAFSTGRRMFALRQVKQAAQAAGHVDLAAHCEAAITQDSEVRAMEARWAGQGPEAQFGPEAKQLDVTVDGALAALRDGLDAAARASEPGDPLGDAAVELADKLFPRGLAEITKLPFVEELAEVGRVLQTVTGPEWAPKVADLGIGRHVQRLSALEPKYRAALENPGAKLSYAAVKEARSKGQSRLLQAVAMILGLHPSDAPQDVAARGQLLGPVLRQNEAIREYLRLRRPVQDVDPATGQLEPLPATPPGGDPPAGDPPA